MTCSVTALHRAVSAGTAPHFDRVLLLSWGRLFCCVPALSPERRLARKPSDAHLVAGAAVAFLSPETSVEVAISVVPLKAAAAERQL